jgi:hypothetical protein
VACQGINWRADKRVATVRSWLAGQERGTAQPQYFDHALRPVAAMTELIFICESILDEGRKPPRQGDRESVQRDLKLAASRLGPALKRALWPELRDYKRDQLNALPRLLDDADGVRSVRDASHVMLERIGRPECAVAVWQDLVAALNDRSDLDSAWLQLFHLRDVELLIGHDWPRRAGELSRALLSDGLASGEPFLCTPPDTSGRVSWLIFGNASMEPDALRIGQIQFFSDRIWPGQVTDPAFFADQDHLEYPDELQHAPLLKALRPNDESMECVYARVELAGPRATGQRNPYVQKRAAGDWARDLVSSAVDAATFSSGGSRWTLLTGELVFHTLAPGGQQPLTGNPTFDNPARVKALREFRPPGLEGTGNALETLRPELAELLADSDRVASASVREARWFQAARQAADPAQRVVLFIRAFERSLPLHPGERWDGAVRRIFREFWAEDRFDNDLVQLAHTSEDLLRLHDPGALSRLPQWIEHRPPNWFRANLAAFMTLAGQIEKALEPMPYNTWTERLILRALDRMQRHPRRAYDALREFGGHFDLLLARARRQRNAVVHGIRTNPEVVATVERFIERLAASVDAQNLHSAAIGEDRDTALSRGQENRLQTLERLKTEPAPASSILYPDTPPIAET